MGRGWFREVGFRSTDDADFGDEGAEREEQSAEGGGQRAEGGGQRAGGGGSRLAVEVMGAGIRMAFVESLTQSASLHKSWPASLLHLAVYGVAEGYLGQDARI